jgi:hypothetical protein
MGDWDMGLSHFYGTSRDPIFLLKGAESGAVNLIPYYQNINQTGLDIQATLDSLLLKWEATIRVSESETAFATTAGFDYTFFNIMSSGIDIGLLSEYLSELTHHFRLVHFPSPIAD